MTLPATTKNAMLDALTINQASLHSSFPGATGTGEISGGTPAYARKAITVAASSAGQRIQSSSVDFDVPASTIRWIGFWGGTSFVSCAPNGGATPKNFMSSGSVIYSAAHGYTDGQKVTFYQGAPPLPLTEGAVYYVVSSAEDSFSVASTLGGSAIAFTAPPSFGCLVCAITEEVYGTQSVHRLTTSTHTVPD